MNRTVRDDTPESHGPVQVAVIGVGHHGRHHARNFAAMDGVELVGVADADADAAGRVAAEHGCEASADPAAYVDRVDAVSVVVPTVHHFAVTREYLRSGIACLVEKPMAFSTDQAAEMVRLAAVNRTRLQVGHIERFNPVWQAATADLPRPTHIDVHRASRYPFRSLDVSVVFDVMIHDIDLVLSLIDSPVADVEATGMSLLSPAPDRVEARLRFADGRSATLRADRVHTGQVRRMDLWHEAGSDSIDFMRRRWTRCRLTDRPSFRRLAAVAPQDRPSEQERLFADETRQADTAAEPMRAELESFVAAVRNRTRPAVSGDDGLRAVEIASRIESRLATAMRRAA